MIGATFAALLLAPIGIEPAKTVDPRPSTSSSAAASATKTPQMDLSAALVERLERLSKMSGEERAEALADLPPERRVRIEKGLEQLDALTPERRQAWFDRYRRFNELTEKQKEDVRKVSSEISTLSPARSTAVREELETYRHMPMYAREARMKSPDFRSKFNPEEREILHSAAILLREPTEK